MMIQAVLGNPRHPEYGVATIPFPTSLAEIMEGGQCSRMEMGGMA